MIPIEKLKEEMMVRLTNDASNSINDLGGGDIMRKMQGGVYKIDRVSNRSVRLVSDVHGHWWFLPEDLYYDLSDEELAEKIKQDHPPVMFDPANL